MAVWREHGQRTVVFAAHTDGCELAELSTTQHMCITITGLDWSVCDKLAGKYAEGVCLKFNKTGSAMASAGRRKRRVRVDESLITDVRHHSNRLPQNRLIVGHGS